MKTILICLFVIALCVVQSTLIAAPKKPKMAKPKPVGDKPDVSRLEPRGIQRGIETKIKLIGTNLVGVSEVKFSNEKLHGEILEDEEKPTEAWITVTTPSDLTRGGYEFSLKNEKGESAKVKLYVDDLPQVLEIPAESISKLPSLPVTFWGALNPTADSDDVEFQAKAGQTLVFDFAAKSIGSKANAMLSLFDAKGNLLASNNDFDEGDPLLSYKFVHAGIYRMHISDETLGGSDDHFYRLSVGEFPEVVGIFPLSVTTNAEAEVELVGLNLPPNSRAKFKADKPGEVEIPLNLEKFHARKTFKVLVTDESERLEVEPNNSSSAATKVEVPGSIGGRIFSTGKEADVDLFQFDAKAGQVLFVDTMASRRGSPIDTRIEILHRDGKPVERLLLQGVRDSQITFRPIDANSPDVRVENWEEMELNQLLYMRGEVCKIFRMPQGPDSGFQFYTSNGKRAAYFDTTPTAHANDENCYIVEPHPPGSKLVANGLPVFPLYYANDDDGARRLGSDSRIQFTAPEDATYLVRVSDSRGFGGERFAYRLSVREAKPDFKVTLNGANPTVPPGSGQEFSFATERIDGFDGEIKIDISGLPAGFVTSSPLVIQAGHTSANGTIFAASDAKEPADLASLKILATAMVNGKEVAKDVSGFGKIKLGEKPKLFVAIEPYIETQTNFVERSIAEKPPEITIAPGQIVPIWLKIKRAGHDDLVTFTVENLPHGVIVDNIGLSGVLIPKGENERQIFLKAARWVPDTDRLAYCQAKQAGSPTSLPVLIHVRKPESELKISALK
ncbi:MAG: hypothetical protein ABIQ35_05730 [Verrucomicrobiota bacterium]